MDSKFIFSTVVVFITVLSASTNAYSKMCTPYCGDETFVTCPSNYSCTDWDGCGPSCLRETGYQPDFCPMVNCVATNCPLGFERDGSGCEGCNCAHMDAMKLIEEEAREYKGKGSASQVAVHTSMYMALAYTVINYFC